MPRHRDQKAAGPDRSQGDQRRCICKGKDINGAPKSADLNAIFLFRGRHFFLFFFVGRFREVENEKFTGMASILICPRVTLRKERTNFENLAVSF